MTLKDIVDQKAQLTIVCEENEKKIYETEKVTSSDKVIVLQEIDSIQPNSQENIAVALPDSCYTSKFFNTIFKLLKPGGKLIILKLVDRSKIEFEIKTNGFINVQQKSDDILVCTTPTYELGSQFKLNLKPKAASAVWKLDDTVDDEVETIDPDNLLDDEDLMKPDPSSLRVCGTTGKRKACKDCSCGLAEELASEAKDGKVVDTSNAPKSSCGSCYLGDAFRCASCPYLGMPAFKPGEKIQLPDSQLKADV